MCVSSPSPKQRGPYSSSTAPSTLFVRLDISSLCSIHCFKITNCNGDGLICRDFLPAVVADVVVDDTVFIVAVFLHLVSDSLLFLFSFYKFGICLNK